MTISEKAAKLVFEKYNGNVDSDSIMTEIEKAVSEILYGHPHNVPETAYDEKVVFAAVDNYYFMLDDQGVLV